MYNSTYLHVRSFINLLYCLTLSRTLQMIVSTVRFSSVTVTGGDITLLLYQIFLPMSRNIIKFFYFYLILFLFTHTHKNLDQFIMSILDTMLNFIRIRYKLSKIRRPKLTEKCIRTFLTPNLTACPPEKKFDGTRTVFKEASQTLNQQKGYEMQNSIKVYSVLPIAKAVNPKFRRINQISGISNAIVDAK